MSPNKLHLNPPKPCQAIGNRDRYVDSDHSDLDAAPEFAADVAVARIALHAIAEFVIVDELDRLGEVVCIEKMRRLFSRKIPV